MMQGGNFRGILIENSGKVRELFSSLQEKKVAFWGVGRRLQIVMELFKDDINFEFCFIDSRKAGSIYKGREISSYEQVVNENDVILLLNHMYESEIRDMIDHYHGKEQVFIFDRFIK